MDRTFYGITLLKEEDFAAFSTELKLWNKGIPLRPGDKFPSDEQQRRADIDLTMNTLVSNELGKVLSQFITTWPDLEPITNRKTANIVAQLPIFDIITKTWKLLLKSCFKGVEVDKVERKDLFNAIWPILDDIIVNQFTCCDRVTSVYKKGANAFTKVYSDKNIILFRTKDSNTVITISNLSVDENDHDQVEFISYLPDSTIVRNVFEYGAGKLGRHLVKNERVEADNAVVFAKNGSSQTAYGYPELAGSLSAALGVIRAFAVLTQLTEKKKELLRVVPDSMVRKDPYTGASAFVSGGTVAYDTANPEASAHNHDVDFKTPNLQLNEAIDTLEAFFKQVSIYSGLSGVILGYQTIGGNESGKSIIASCVPTMIQANGYLVTLKDEVKEIVYNICKAQGEVVDIESINIVTTNPDKTLLNLISDVDDLTDEKRETT